MFNMLPRFSLSKQTEHSIGGTIKVEFRFTASCMAYCFQYSPIHPTFPQYVAFFCSINLFVYAWHSLKYTRIEQHTTNLLFVTIFFGQPIQTCSYFLCHCHIQHGFLCWHNYSNRWDFCNIHKWQEKPFQIYLQWQCLSLIQWNITKLYHFLYGFSFHQYH